MEKIPFLLKKLQELQDLPIRKTRIDIDLMLDYSRKLYGELLDLRDGVSEDQAFRDPDSGSSMPEDSMARELIPGRSVSGEPVSKESESGEPLSPSSTSQSATAPPSVPAPSSTPQPAAPAIPAATSLPSEPENGFFKSAAPVIPARQEQTTESLHIPTRTITPVGESFPPDPEAPPTGDDTGSAQPPDNQEMSGSKAMNEPLRQPYESGQSGSGHEITPAPPAAPKKDIRRSIGINDKYQIISELFHNDKEAYETAVNEINNSETATGAIDWLHDHVAWNYNWSEDNYTVQLFYGLISQHFKHQTG